MEHKDFKYMHVEHWDTDEVMYLKDAPVLWVQPKIDGTNCFVAYEDGKIVVGSRNRWITPEDDNQGCAKYIFENLYDKLLAYFKRYSDFVLYGEFTIVHTFKVKPEYLGKFYIFDVFDRKTNIYMAPGTLESNYGLDFVPTEVIRDADKIPDLPKYIQENCKKLGKFLMEDSFETGEGYVIKDYSNDRRNKYGRTCWAKVLNEKPKFEGKHVAGKDFWLSLREKFFTDAFIEKETIKYLENYKLTEIDNFNKYANIVIAEFIKEEIANIVFKFKYPKINFQELKVNLTKILREKNDKTL